MARETAADAFNRLIGNALAIVTSFVSALVLTIIVTQHGRVEITLIVIFTSIIWVFIDRQLRKLFEIYPVTKQNRQWHTWLTRFMDFILLLAIFLVAQLVLLAVKTAVEDAGFNLYESLAFILPGMGIAFAIMISIQMVSETIEDPSEPLPPPPLAPQRREDMKMRLAFADR
jgi:hypothetical protein